jgi:hypothetical protein
MKLTKIFIALMLLVGTGNAFAKANNETEDRHLSGFHAVNVAGSFDVYIVQGGKESVRVDAPADVIHHIITDVKNGTLNIYTKDHMSWGNIFGGGHKKIVVYVSIKDVTGISLTGSGDVYFKEGINANSLKLGLTGSGDVTGRVNVKNLESSVTGSGDIKVSGHADNSRVSVTGSGDYSGRDLATVNTSARVGGSGDVGVNVSGSLDASVTGSGDIHYTGNPKNIRKSKTGSGDIDRF